MWPCSVTCAEVLGVARIWCNSDTPMAGGCADRVANFGYILKCTWDLLMGRAEEDKIPA